MHFRSLLSIALATALGFGSEGCTKATRPPGVAVPAPFSQYRLPGFDWASIRRVLVLPLWNESSEPRASHEIQQVLCAELQRLGLCEIVVAPFDAPPDWSRRVRVSGQFDELELVELAQAYHVDTVLCGAVTHYHAYAPPRIGLSLRLISTAEGLVVSSVDGMWDARDQIVADDACSFYGLYITKSQASSNVDVVLGSPHLFQKYVCGRVSQVILGPTRSGPPLVLASPPHEYAVEPE